MLQRLKRGSAAIVERRDPAVEDANVSFREDNCSSNCDLAPLTNTSGRYAVPSGELAPGHYRVTTLLQGELPAQSYGRALLAPGAKPPVAIAPRGRAICTCFDVTDAQIQSCLAQAEGDEDQRLAQLQGRLRCGTNCGSCVPELKRMARSFQPQLSI